MSWGRKMKWWEVAATEDERNLFVLIARDPRYEWRKVSTILTELDWTHEHLEEVIAPYLKRRMVYVFNGEKGLFLGYWERVEKKVKAGLVDPKDFDTDEEVFDLNVI